MPLVPRPRLVNPRLGAYFGIFVGIVATLFILVLIFEQLGVSPSIMRAAMILIPVAGYAGIGALAFTQEPPEFFAAGRRVPAVFVGLPLAISAIGAVGIVATTGVFFIAGFDAICLVIGGVAGLVAMALLLAPFLRKHGAYTVPSFIGRRLHSRFLRLLAGALLAVPILLVIVAELRMGATALALLTGHSTAVLSLLFGVAVLATLIAGGMRSLAWSNVAQAIVVVLALAVPTAIVGVIETNLPIPQLSHGPVLRGLGRSEVLQGVPMIAPAPLALNLPGQELAVAAKRFAAPFGDVGSLGFVLMSLVMMAGLGAAPWLLPRLTTTPSVYEARKSLGWAVFVFGFVMVTVASIAVFLRDAVMDAVVAGAGVPLPAWLGQLAEMGLAQLPKPGERLAVSSFAFQRDAMIFALPMVSRMPAAFLDLLLAGAVAAALLGASTATMALAAILSEDVLGGLSWEPLPARLNVLVGRGAIAAAVLLATLLGIAAGGDPLMLFLWAVALSAATAFPVLVLAVWWKRLTTWGAVLGMISGFALTLVLIVATEAQWIGIRSPLAGALGVPLAFAVAIIVSQLVPELDRAMIEAVRDIRVPGGETLHDKELRLLRLKQRQRA